MKFSFSMNLDLFSENCGSVMRRHCSGRDYVRSGKALVLLRLVLEKEMILSPFSQQFNIQGIPSAFP